MIAITGLWYGLSSDDLGLKSISWSCVQCLHYSGVIVAAWWYERTVCALKHLGCYGMEYHVSTSVKVVLAQRGEVYAPRHWPRLLPALRAAVKLAVMPWPLNVAYLVCTWLPEVEALSTIVQRLLLHGAEELTWTRCVHMWQTFVNHMPAGPLVVWAAWALDLGWV